MKQICCNSCFHFGQFSDSIKAADFFVQSATFLKWNIRIVEQIGSRTKEVEGCRLLRYFFNFIYNFTLL